MKERRDYRMKKKKICGLGNVDKINEIKKRLIAMYFYIEELIIQTL